MHTIEAMVKNVLWGLSGGMVAGVFAFIGSIFVARNLDVNHYGVLQLATTYYIFLQLIENFSNHNVVKLEMIKHKSDSWLIAHASAQVIFFCYVIALLVMGIFYYLNRSLILFYVIILTSGQLFRAGLGIAYYFEVRLETQWSQISTALGSFIQSIYRIFASFNGQILWQCFAILVGNFISFISLCYFLRRNHRSLEFKVVFTSRSLDIFKKSLPMMLVSIVSILIYKLDVLVLGYYGLTSQISYYTNAVKFAEPWNFVAASIIGAMAPNIIGYKTVSLNKYYRYLRYLFFILTLTAVLLAIVVSLFSDLIILYTYGPKYMESAKMLRIHIWSNIFLFWALAQQVWEINEGMKRFLFVKTLIGVILNFILNFSLIPVYGGMGCVISSMVTYFYVAFLGNLLHRKARFLAFQIVLAVLTNNGPKMIWEKLKKYV